MLTRACDVEPNPNSVMPGCKENCAYFADDLFGIRAAIGVRNAGRACVDRAPIGARAAITTKPTPKQEALC